MNAGNVHVLVSLKVGRRINKDAKGGDKESDQGDLCSHPSPPFSKRLLPEGILIPYTRRLPTEIEKLAKVSGLDFSADQNTELNFIFSYPSKA